MTNKEQHHALLSQWEQDYQKSDFEYCAFTQDGPSDWDSYYCSFPHILFLVKESPYFDYNPSKPGQQLDGKFTINIARWSLLIDAAFQQMPLPEMPLDEQLRKNNDSIAIVEVKKICEEKGSSPDREINRFAHRDRDYLKEQIKLLEPHVVFCGGTIDAYDIIHDWEYNHDEKIASIEGIEEAIWLTDNRLIIAFKHPSHRKDPKAVYDILKSLLSQGPVKEAIQRMSDNFRGSCFHEPE